MKLRERIMRAALAGPVLQSALPQTDEARRELRTLLAQGVLYKKFVPPTDYLYSVTPFPCRYSAGDDASLQTLLGDWDSLDITRSKR